MDYRDRLERPSARTTWAWPAVAACLMLWPLFWWTYTVDDAFISWRYVWNLRMAGELAWNVGDRVEGFSHPLFVVLLTAGSYAPLPLPVVAKVIGVLAYAGLVLQATRLAGSLGRSTSWAALALASSASVGFWSVAGLETSVYACLLVSAIRCLVEDRPTLLAWTLAALTVSRPEGALVGAGLALVSGRRATMLGVVSSMWLTAEVARVAYYGAWLPNAWAVKVHEGPRRLVEGVRYIALFAIAQAPMLIWVRPPKRLVPALAASTLPVTAFAVWAGGDWMPGFRYLVPLLPVLAVAVRPPSTPVLVVCLLLRAGLDVTLADLPGRPPVPTPEAQAATWLSRVAPRGTVIATTEAGELPFLTPQFRYIDLIGLNDRHLALRATRMLNEDEGDPAYVAAQCPLYLVSWGRADPAVTPEPASARRLLAEPRFAGASLVASFPYDAAHALFIVSLPGCRPARK